MTTPFLAADLRRDEGLRLEAYPDPLTHGEPWTIGYGHAAPDVREGLIWTLEQAEAALAADTAHACRMLDQYMGWWRGLNDPRQDVLAEMTFNLGIGRLEGFVRALVAIRVGNWQGAHDQLLDSEWARQVGERAQRLALQMLTGERAMEAA